MNTTLPTPRKIVCFGDSNTWGYVPNTAGERYDAAIRWPGVLQRRLGSDFTVLEEALNGRTTVWDDPIKPGRNGSKHLPTILETHAPIDLVIIALGVNDLKHHLNRTAIDIAFGMQRLAEIVLQSRSGRMEPERIRRSPEVLLIAPALPVNAANPLGHKFDGARERGAGVGNAIADVADEIGCLWLDADDVVTIPELDGIHLDDKGHRELGNAIVHLLLQNHTSASPSASGS